MDNIHLKETLTIEFKSDLKCLPDNDIIEAVVAFANTDGGDFYLGIEDNGDITGLHPKHEKIDTLTQLFDEAPSKSDNDESTLTHITDTDDPLDQTSEISGVNLEELKAIQAELKKAIEEDSFTDTNPLENAGDSQSKGKSLVKATKQGRAFSNGSMTKTFLDCTILGFVTAAMGFGWLINIINHI